MPIPTPQPDETTPQFIDRCVADRTMVDEFPSVRERLAVCFSQIEDEQGENGASSAR